MLKKRDVREIKKALKKKGVDVENLEKIPMLEIKSTFNKILKSGVPLKVRLMQLLKYPFNSTTFKLFDMTVDVMAIFAIIGVIFEYTFPIFIACVGSYSLYKMFKSDLLNLILVIKK